MGVQTSQITTASGDLTIQPNSGQTLIKSVTTNNPGVTPVAAASDGTVKKFVVTDLNTKSTLDDSDWVVVHDSATGNTVKVPGSQFGGSGGSPTGLNALEVAYDNDVFGANMGDTNDSRGHNNIFTVSDIIYSHKVGDIWSSDDGYHWSHVGKAGGATNACFMGYDYSNNLFIFGDSAAGSVGKKSSDGAFWTSLGSIGGDEHFFIAASPTTGTWISTKKGSNAKIYRSTDQGTSWTDMGNAGTSGVAKKKVFAVSNGDFFMEFNTSLYKSTDDGNNWTSVGTAIGSSLSNQSYIRENDSGVLVYLNPSSNSFNAKYSTDGGNNWSPVGQTLSGWSGSLTNSFIQNIVWAGGAWHGFTKGNRGTPNVPCLAFTSTDLQNWTYHAGVGATQQLRSDLGANSVCMAFSVTHAGSGSVTYPNYYKLDI